MMNLKIAKLGLIVNGKSMDTQLIVGLDTLHTLLKPGDDANTKH
jgi:hypothetical protein